MSVNESAINAEQPRNTRAMLNGEPIRQELENILPSEVEAIRGALLTSRMLLCQEDTPTSRNMRDMIEYALRIIEYRSRGQAENDRHYTERFARDCEMCGAD